MGGRLTGGGRDFRGGVPDSVRAPPVGGDDDRPSGSFEQEQILLGPPPGLALVFVTDQALVGRARLRVVLDGGGFEIVRRQGAVVVRTRRRFRGVQQRHRVPVHHVTVEQLVAQFRVRHGPEPVFTNGTDPRGQYFFIRRHRHLNRCASVCG